MITLKCPSCGTTKPCDDRYAGKRIRCKKCNNTFSVPAQTASPKSPPTSPPPGTSVPSKGLVIGAIAGWLAFALTLVVAIVVLGRIDRDGESQEPKVRDLQQQLDHARAELDDAHHRLDELTQLNPDLRKKLKVAPVNRDLPNKEVRNTPRRSVWIHPAHIRRLWIGEKDLTIPDSNDSGPVVELDDKLLKTARFQWSPLQRVRAVSAGGDATIFEGASIGYPDSCRDRSEAIRGYIQIDTTEPDQLDGATTYNPGQKVVVDLRDGKSIAGFMPLSFLTLNGKTPLGDAKIKLSNLRTIEFLSFALVGKKDENRAISANDAIRLLTHQRSNSTSGKPPRRWKITGAVNKFVEDIHYFDSYSTNVSGIIIYYGRSWRTCRSSQSLNLTTGPAESSLAFDSPNLKAFSFGQETHTKAALKKVALTLKDSGTIQATLKSTTYAGGNSSYKYKHVDPQDSIAWRTPYGFEGVEVLRLSNTTFEAQP